MNLLDKCQIFLEKEQYAPGETLNGRVHCDFGTENNVIKGITVKITGDAKVFWKVSAYTYRRAQEIYFENDLQLLKGEVTLPSDSYDYPFSFTLPTTSPSSMCEGDPTYRKTVASYVVPFNLINVYYGCVQYTIKVTIERSWTTNLEAEKIFNVTSSHDLNAVAGLEKPTEYSIGKRPTSLFKTSGPITITVHLPKSGYVPAEKMPFTLNVKNASTIDLQYVQFKFAQGYVFHAEQNTKIVDTFLGEEFVPKDSDLPAGNERSWKLELPIPAMPLGDYTHCNLIKMFWELRGEVCLPFPNSSFMIHVPITLGSAPLASTM